MELDSNPRYNLQLTVDRLLAGLDRYGRAPREGFEGADIVDAGHDIDW